MDIESLRKLRTETRRLRDDAAERGDEDEKWRMMGYRVLLTFLILDIMAAGYIASL